MKYKVGDKVKIRKDLKGGEYYGEVYCNPDMAKNWAGEIVTIVDIDMSSLYKYNDVDTYKIADDEYEYSWSAEMFEDNEESVKPMTVMTVADLLNKTDVEQGGLIICIYYPNAYFETTIGHNKINRNSELYKRFIKAYGDMVVDEVSFDVKDDCMVVMRIKVDYAD